GIDSEDRVCAPIEDEVLAGRRLLKSGRIAKAPGDARGNAARRSDDVRLARRHRGRGNDEGEDADWKDSLQGRGQYSAVSRIAFSTSAACGRMASSRIGL